MTQTHPSAELMAACEKEPIHIPGAIQPFGLLLGVDRPQLMIRNASANCETILGVAASELIGRSFAEFVSADQLAELNSYLDGGNLRDKTPLQIRLADGSATQGQQWELSAHEQAGCLILELEAFSEDAKSGLDFHWKVRDAVQALQSAGSMQQLCEVAVRQVQNITGFDRVMLYRFTEDWHGAVIAEACQPNMDAYLGHHFPASDIPPQARAVFLQNWLRMIPQVDYTPVPLYPGINPLNGAPLDLGFATLRSVSPVHLEYLRNMNVAATLTISLMDEGKLWGLIACHHGTPLRINTDARLGAKMVGQLVSSQIKLKQSLDDLHYRAKLRGVHEKLVGYMSQEEDLVEGLIKHTPNMLDIAAAGGAAAALYYDDRWTVIGATPPVAEIEELVDWLAANHPSDTVFCTDRLSTHFPPAARYKEVASGLLAIAIPKTERNYILWFRPEVVSTVTWAGKPEKAVRQEGNTLALHPRASFKSWQEIVTGTAVPWQRVEVEAVLELRNSILALDLRREFKREQAARAQVERASREKENMVNMVSHDLRTPLSVAKMSFDYLQRYGMNQAEVAKEIIARGIRATNSIERLANDILDIAKVDAGTLTLNLRIEPAETLVRHAAEIFTPLLAQKNITLQTRLDAPGDEVACDRQRIEQVFNNLIGNALKFTPPAGMVTLSVERRGSELIFCVADTGPGISQEHLPRIFDRFWQEDHAKLKGTGLGLSITKGIIDKHCGKIWAESELEKGSRFLFSLPRRSE